MTSMLGRLVGITGGGGRMSYSVARRLAADQDDRVRRKLARRSDVQGEILYFLAEDPQPEIRREIAENAATPAKADLLLARDRDDEVRCHVARKISQLVPSLDEEQQNRIGTVVTEILQILAADQLPRVRRILADELKHAVNAPVEVIDRLARDDDLDVAAPVLEWLPLLSDDVLMEIIHSRPVQGALATISRRVGLGPEIADAIIAHDDEAATAALLANASAQIREETLDALVARANGVTAWHKPMVMRPQLSAQAIRTLAGFVADSLLDRLEKRSDIDPQTARVLSASVRERLDAEPVPVSEDILPTPSERAERLYHGGRLDEKTVAAALDKGDRGFVVAAIALLSGLSRPIVQKIVSMASAKGTTALAWKAGLSVGLAVQLQLRLSRIAPGSVLKPKGGDGFPLSEDEMVWQLEFFAG